MISKTNIIIIKNSNPSNLKTNIMITKATNKLGHYFEKGDENK